MNRTITSLCVAFVLAVLLTGCGGGGDQIVNRNGGTSTVTLSTASSPSPVPSASPSGSPTPQTSPSPSPATSPTPTSSPSPAASPTPAGSPSPSPSPGVTLTSITVTPSGASIHDVGDTLQMKAVANFSDGTTQDITSTAQWSAPGANISATGLLSGKGTPANAAVTATKSSVSGQTTVGLRQAIYCLDATAGTVFRIDDMQGSGFVQATPSTAFSSPLSIAVDTHGRIDVADAGGAIFGVIQFPSITNNNVTVFQNGSPGAIDPIGIAVDDSDRIYWTDAATAARPIFRMDDINGTNITNFTNKNFNTPTGIFVDATFHIYITDQINAVYRVDDMTGSNLQTLTNPNINFPNSVWVDGQGRPYIADVNNLTVDRFDSIFGGAPTSFSTLNSGITGPGFAAVDAQGRVYYTQATLAGQQLVRVDDISGANPVILSGTPVTVNPSCVYIR